jgi:hypothetical protein
MSNYYDKQEGKVKICHELMNRGWKVYGYHADESDSMSDYWSPAHWGGIAEKNGYILVVDNNNDSKGEKIEKYNPKGNLSQEDREKIIKLEAMTQLNGCTAGEETNAKELIEKIKLKISGVSSYVLIGMIPAHMANPGKCKWHIEKDGKIYDKGTGIVKYSDIPKEWEFDINKMEYKESHKKVWTGTDENGCRIMEDRILPEETRKIINDFKALILRFERVTMGITSCGDGTEETEKEGIEKQQKTGYEKVIITEYKIEIKANEIEKPEQITDTMYFILKGSFTNGCSKGNVYKINSVKENPYNHKYYIDANRMNEKLNKVLTGRATAANSFDVELEKFKKWLDNNSIAIVELSEVNTPYEVEKWVKIDKTAKKYNTSKKAEQTQTTEEATQPEQAQETITSDIYTITADTDTRDNSALWVVKLVNRVDSEEFNRIRSEVMKPIDGYYSRFKGGFIFKYNPTSKLINTNVEQEQETTEQAQTENNTAENIIDYSTEIITELNINGEDITSNEQYKRQLEKKISKDDITADVLTYLKVNEYNLIAEVLEEITSIYWQPEIKDGFIYSCHFKSWDIPMEEIKETIISMNIPFIDWNEMSISTEKIAFIGITAVQARQAKEISDINGSIFFIDYKMPENKYNTITEEQPEQEEQQEETETSNNIIDFEEYKNNNEVKMEEQKQTITEQPEQSEEDIFSKFDNIEIDNNSRISANDEEFCKNQENQYKQFIDFSNNYMQYLENNSINNSMYSSNDLIKEMTEERTNKKCWFINKIVEHFRSTYKVTLTSKPIQDKYSLDINYNTIVSEIIEQLEGYNFRDKAEKEIKDEFKQTIKYEKVEIKNKKILIDSFFYAESWDYGRGKQFKVSYSSDDKFCKLFKALSHFLFGTNKDFNNYFDNIYDIITRKENDDVFKIHDITNKITQTLKLYKNGKIDIEFSTPEYARKFAKEYCGYIEKSA